ncbi:unnamed protein product, partial [marine sediment metagenome]
RADVFKKVTFEFRNAETPDFITTRRDNETSLFFEVTEEEALKGASKGSRVGSFFKWCIRINEQL